MANEGEGEGLEWQWWWSYLIGLGTTGVEDSLYVMGDIGGARVLLGWGTGGLLGMGKLGEESMWMSWGILEVVKFRETMKGVTGDRGRVVTGEGGRSITRGRIRREVT